MSQEKVSDRELDISEEVDAILRQISRGKERLPFPLPRVGPTYAFRALLKTPIDAMGFTMTELRRQPSIAVELSSVKAAHELRMLASSVEHMKHELISCKEKIENLQRMMEERPVVKETSIFDVGDNLQVVQAIPVVIEETRDEIIASFPEVEVYGVGSSEAEALSNLKAEIRDLYFELTELRQDELGRLPLGWRRVLERLIQRVG